MLISVVFNLCFYMNIIRSKFCYVTYVFLFQLLSHISRIKFHIFSLRSFLWYLNVAAVYISLHGH